MMSICFTSFIRGTEVEAISSGLIQFNLCGYRSPSSFREILSYVCENYLVIFAYDDIGLLLSFVGVINVYATTPMWVVNMRLKLQGKANRGSNQSSDLETNRAPQYKGMLGELQITRSDRCSRNITNSEPTFCENA